MRTATPLLTWSVIAGRRAARPPRRRSPRRGPSGPGWRMMASGGSCSGPPGGERRSRPCTRAGWGRRRRSPARPAAAAARPRRSVASTPSRSWRDRGDRPPLQRGRQQGGRGDQGHLGAQGGVGGDLGPGHPAVADVAHDQPPAGPRSGRVPSSPPPQDLAHGVEVEQGLGRVLVPAVTGVDHRAVVDPLGHPGRHPRRGVADDHGVHADGLDGLDGVAQRLALLDRRGPGGERQHVGRHPLGRRLERHAGPGRVLEEQGGDRAAAQGRHLRVGPAADLGEGVGHPQHLGDRRRRRGRPC